MKSSYIILEYVGGNSHVVYAGIETLTDALDILVSLRAGGSKSTYTLHAQLNV